jgi:hypothetical protein
MVNGSLRVLRLLPPLKLVAMIDIAEILLKVALSTINQINQIESIFNRTTNCSINMKMQFGWPICVESHFQQYFSYNCDGKFYWWWKPWYGTIITDL